MIAGFETACLASVHIGKDMATAVSMSIPPLRVGKTKPSALHAVAAPDTLKTPFSEKIGVLYLSVAKED